MSRKRITVIEQNETGRNMKFKDNYNGSEMTRTQFVKKINNGEYPNYEVANINGTPTPKAKRDKSRKNNLG